jgi:hypothetical protein
MILFLTATLNVVLAAFPALSVTKSATEKTPLIVGVPVIKPVAEFRFSPGGSPFARNVIGEATESLAVIWSVNSV